MALNDNLVIKSIVTDNRITAHFSDKQLPRYARHGELYFVGGILYIFADLDDSNQGKWFPITNEKEVYTYEQPDEEMRWIIPIDFNTEHLEVIIYDSDGLVFRNNFYVDIDELNVVITFDSPISGQAYVVTNKNPIYWIDNKIIVADNKFLFMPSENNPNEFDFIVDSKNVQIQKDGLTRFANDFVVGGSLTVEGNQTLDSDVNIGGNLQVDGNTTIDGDLRVKGVMTTIATEEIKLDDNVVTLNSNAVGVPTENAGIEVSRGDEGILPIVTFDETLDKVTIPVKQEDGSFLQDEIAGKIFVQTGLAAEVTRATLADEVLTNNIKEETTRATAAESTLSTNLNNEITRAKGVEGQLISLQTVDKTNLVSAINELNINLDNEVTRSTTAETTLSNNINTEISNRISADNTLTTNLNNEITRATTAETTLQGAIDSEESARISADNTLTTNLNNEITRATTAETTLQGNINTEKGRIDSILSASTADKDSFAEIVSLINSVDTVNDTAFGSYATNNNARSTTIEDDLASEIIRATNAESALDSTITSLIQNGPYASLSGSTTQDFNGDNIIANSSVKSPIYYASDNINFYADLSNTGTSINCAGAIVSAGDVTAFSDKSIKDNIVTIPDALDKVMELRGVSYTRNDIEDTDTKHIGVIAQEIENIIPEVVSENANGMKSVAYGNIVGVLIEAVKEQQTQVNELKEIIKQLQGK